MEYGAFAAAVDRGEVPAVVLLHGAEPVLTEDVIARMAVTVPGAGAEAAFARETVDVREAGVDAAVRAARTLPFSGGRRLVVARGVEALAEKSAAALFAYLAEPNPTAVLVLVSGRPLEAGHWLVKALPPVALVAAALPPGRALGQWMRARARAKGLELADDAAQLLVELVGDEPGALAAEMDKAALVGGPDNRHIGIAEVEAVVGARRARSIFDLLRALEARDRGRALAVLQSLLDAGEEPLVVLTMLTREARALWQVKEWRRQGREPEEIARALRRPPGVGVALVARAEAMGPDEAPRGLSRCWDTERRLKLGANARAELTLLISDLCGA